MAVGIVKPVIRGEPGSKSGLSTIGTLVGAGVGALAGGPSGAATGANLGGTAGNLINPGTAPTPTTVGQGGVEAGAIGRRIQTQEGDNLVSLKQSLDALQQAPEPIRQKYAEPLLTAFTMEAKKRGGYGNPNSNA